MIDMLLALAATAQEGPLILRDNLRGPTAVENRTLSQPHPNSDPRMFPDLAVKDLRIEGDTLYVLVANVGRARSAGQLRITARAEANGVKAEAAPVRIARLMGGEKRWVPVRAFAVRSAAADQPTAVFALQDATMVSAEVAQPPALARNIDRSGRGADVRERNLANNGLRAPGKAIARGRPQ